MNFVALLLVITKLMCDPCTWEQLSNPDPLPQLYSWHFPVSAVLGRLQSWGVVWSHGWRLKQPTPYIVHNFQSSRKPVNSKYNPTYNCYTKPKSRPNMSISEWPGWEVQCQRDVLIHPTEGLSPPVVSFLAVFGHTTDKSYQLLQQCHMDGNPMEKLCIGVEEQQNLRGGTSVFVWRTERIWMKWIFVGSKK